MKTTMRLTRMGVIRPYRNVKRLWRIFVVFVRCGWECLRARKRLRRAIRTGGQAQDLSLCIGQNLRQAIESLGPTFIKFGQLLSTRRDILPAEVATELARLQDSVTAIPTQEAIRVVEQEYGCPLQQVFSEFSPVALGSASLSQVHEARLASTGETVVVKIQRPGIQAVVETDIDILTCFIPMLERFVEAFRRLNMRRMVEEFHKTIMMEMDFHREMQNILKFKVVFAEDQAIRIPIVHAQLCTGKLLVMEKLGGVKIDQIDELSRQGYDRDMLSKHLVSMMARQIFQHSFFNADVHAGNFIVMPGNILGSFDFGMVRSIDPETRQLMTDMFVAVTTKDAVRLSKILAAYVEPDSYVDVKQLARELHELIVFYYDLPLKEMRLDTLLETGLDLLVTHKLIIPQQLLMLGRTITMTESLVKMLSPEIIFVQELAPYVRKAIQARVSISSLSSGFSQFAVSSVDTIKALPLAIGTILENLSEGKQFVVCRHEGLDRHVRQFRRMTLHLALSIVGSALFLGSALMFTLQTPESGSLRNTLGAIGLMVAMILFLGLFVSLLRKK